jgi:hypothetical protein
MSKNVNSAGRIIITDGDHTTEVVNVLKKDLGKTGTDLAIEKARRIIELSVDPIAGKPAEPSDGLLYGLIQSGKTSILTVSAAMAADNGFDCLLILTSDNDPLYDQTLDRIRAALGGITVLGKKDWRDPVRFGKQVRTKPFAIVCSKNGSMLKSLLGAFQTAKAKGLSVFIIDDEADQASLNTFASKPNAQVSPMNTVISNFRSYFPVNTYLQVTATPQALFLQRPDHRYRPSFTVVTEPGPSYVGGEAFFGQGASKLLRIVDLNEVTQLKASNQPNPTGKLPAGLRRALYTFLVGASSKIIERPEQGFAFLCHVSMSTKDHEFIQRLIDDFKEETISAFGNKTSAKYNALQQALRDAHKDLSATDPTLASFAEIEAKVAFYIKGANIKLINATSNDEVKLDSKFNIFVGGNKLGRGVTIKNLLVSYYGRNPLRPKADTVLQHARMYGYRKADLGVTRLFLPQRLVDHFTSMHESENSLRELLKEFPDGCFEGLYISGAWSATRGNVLDPNSLGFYTGGNSYNPEAPLRTSAAKKMTAWFDAELAAIKDAPPYETVTIARIIELMEKVELNPNYSPQFWDLDAMKTALSVLQQKAKREKKPNSDKAYLVVKRGRDLTGPRGERKGIISGGEETLAPTDAPTLFFYRQKANSGGEEVWWPQLRFPSGNYVLAFSFDW